MKLKHLQTLAWLSLANLLLVGTPLAFAAPPPATERKSLNDTDREAFNPGPSPLEGTFETVRLEPGSMALPKAAPVVSLDGEWQMLEGSNDDDPFAGLVNNLGVFQPLKITGNWDQPLKEAWDKAIPAEVPAVAVSIERPGHADTFHASENFVWLDPGESKTVEVNATEGLKLEGWNL